MKKKAAPVQSWEIVFPNDANPHGTMFGGKLTAKMDITAGIAAARFADRMVVTASTEAIIFLSPVRIGDRIEFIARVVWTGKTSMVVKVDVFAENLSDHNRVHCTTAHFNFVALDEYDQPTQVPSLLVETEEEKRDYQVAELVKKQALDRKTEIVKLEAASHSKG